MADTALSEAETQPRFGASFTSGLKARAWGLGSIAGGLLIWELISRFLVGNKLFLAAPSQVVVAFFELAGNGELEKHIYISGLEFILGYGVACILGILL